MEGLALPRILWTSVVGQSKSLVRAHSGCIAVKSLRSWTTLRDWPISKFNFEKFLNSFNTSDCSGPGNGNGYGYSSSNCNENNGNSFGPTSITIPIFTVTVNPLEADEMTFVPDSPTDFPIQKKSGRSASEVANMTIIVDDADAKMLNDGYDSDEASRRCSIGSASSLQSDHHHLRLGDLVTHLIQGSCCTYRRP